MNPVDLNINSASGNSANGTALPETNGAVPAIKNGVGENGVGKKVVALSATNGRALSTPNVALPSPNVALPSTNGVAVPEPVEKMASAPRELHRISEVRVQQGTSLRSVSRKMDLSVQEIREQENCTADLRITELLKWQEVLEVPLADLLIDLEGPLSEPVCERARMLRIMKTAKAIKEGAHNRSIVRLANMLIGQLVEIMPELSDVAAWHTVGQRRTQDEVGRIVERAIPDSFFNDSAG